MGTCLCPVRSDSFSFSNLLELVRIFVLFCFLLRSGVVVARLKAHGWLQTQLELAIEIGGKLRDKPPNLCVSVPKKTAKDKKKMLLARPNTP